MNPPPFVLIDDSLSSGGDAWLFENPMEIVACDDPAGVGEALDRIARAGHDGLYAAGFMAYELGYLLEPKLAPLLPEGRRQPLIWMGLFGDPRRLDRDEGRLDWRRPAADLERAVRALNPWPGTWFRHDGERIKVLAAAVVEAPAAAPPGGVVDDRLTVACGSGALRLLRVQRGGRAPAEADAFLRGYPVAAGTRLS